MKAAILALLAVAVTTIEEAQAEMRDRLCEPTNLKFEALKRDLNMAIVEGVNEQPEDAALTSLEGYARSALAGFDPVAYGNNLVEKLGDLLGDRLALEVRAALDENQAA